MKKFNKIMSMLLVAAMLLGLVACGGNTAPATTAPAGTDAPAAAETTAAALTGPVDKYADLGDDYDALSAAVYADVLGEFLSVYEEAKAAESVSERWAKMAIAEAKLLESGVMMPTTRNGGNYAIGRIVPYTVSSQLYGLDEYRLYAMLVTNEIITSEDRAEMKAHYGEVKGDGSYYEWVKQFLADKGYTLKNSYKRTYTSDPKTWDILNTYRTADSEPLVDTYNGLYAYDNENIQQPMLATGVEVSEDGLTYTFTIREGVKWADSQGREVADLTADDFVAGMQHLFDVKGGLEGLLVGKIVNAEGYINGEITDFNEVGVKAPDAYTLVYTLEAPCPYFMTMLGYSIFAPLCRSYYESKGGKFGTEFDSSADSYAYGKTPNDIAYCGPYLISNATANSTIQYTPNPLYWNKEKVNLESITWLYNDGTDTSKAYKDMVAGTIDSTGLNSSTLTMAKEDGNFDKYHYISATDATSFMGFFNVNRAAYANYNDDTQAVSPKTEEQKLATKVALQNVHFRQAYLMAVDRANWNAQIKGDDLALNSLMNSYVPGNFVYLEEETTVDINGTATTFPAGTAYGVVLQAQIDADGLPVTVYDPAADGGLGSGDGYDGWYNPEAAAATLAVAIEELKAVGLEITAENPVTIDVPYPADVEAYANQANVMKQSVEASLGGLVIVNLIACGNGYQGWYDASYYPETGADMNDDLSTVSGWGPDWGDPDSYLDTMLPDYNGSMTKCLGIF